MQPYVNIVTGHLLWSFVVLTVTSVLSQYYITSCEIVSVKHFHMLNNTVLTTCIQLWNLSSSFSRKEALKKFTMSHP